MTSSEGWSSKAYYATEEERKRGLLSIGYGFTYYANGDPVKAGDTMTKAEGDALFKEHIVPKFEETVSNAVNVELSSNQFSALVSLTYNIGGGNLRSSTLLRLVNSGDFESAADEFPKWNKQNKRVLRGLSERRAKERELFLT
jgi:lysozyme